jgi:glycosyltransferase involved in cell wall biosynthesis
MMHEPPTRVLFLSDKPGHPDGVTHGAATYFVQVLPRLAQSNVELTVCFFQESDGTARELRALGIEPVILKRRNCNPRLRHDLTELIASHGIHVIHAVGARCALMAQLAARATGCRCILHFHDTEQAGVVPRLLQRSLMSSVDAAIGATRQICDLVQRNPGVPRERMHWLPNGIDVSPFGGEQFETRRQVRCELDVPMDSRVMGVIGRFSPRKDHAAAIRALASVREAGTDAVLVLVGDGPERARCEALASQLEVADWVHFPGQRRNVGEMLQAMDVLVVPSPGQEGLPYAGIEALAAGRPIVGYADGGVRDLVIHETTGLLVTPGDEDELTDRLIELLSDQRKREQLSEGARRHARQFKVDRHVPRLLGLYRRVLELPDASAHEPDPTPSCTPRSA